MMLSNPHFARNLCVIFMNFSFQLHNLWVINDRRNFIKSFPLTDVKEHPSWGAFGRIGQWGGDWEVTVQGNGTDMEDGGCHEQDVQS